MLPFLKTEQKRKLVVLHRELYGQELIEQARLMEPGAVVSVTTKGDYHLVALKNSERLECLNFLNYLIYLKRTG